MRRKSVKNPQAIQEIKDILGKFLWLGIVCWWVYCTCEFLLYMILYRDVMPQDRDYTCLCWTQHIVFFIVYHILFTRKANKNTILSEPHLKPTVRSFLRKNFRQILFRILIAVLFEVVQTVTDGSPNIASTCLALFIPSAGAIDVPVIRTLVGLSISLASMLASHILCRYRKIPHKTSKLCPDD